MEPRDMGLDWVGRIPKPPLEDVVKSAMGIATEGYTHQLYFRYPLHGGFEAVVKAMIKDRTKIKTGAGIRSIKKKGQRWEVSTGEWTWEFDKLVMAFPVRDAVKCFENVPKEVHDAVAGLRFNALRIACIAVNNDSLLDKSAVYIPDPEVTPHRVCYMGFFSPNVVKPGCSS